MYDTQKNKLTTKKAAGLSMREFEHCGLENNRLLIIEQDVKKLIGITSSLKSEFSRLDKLEKETGDLMNFRGRILGSVSILYFLTVTFGGLFAKVLFDRL